MDINIRKAIKHNIADNDKSQLRETIVDAIQDGQEKMLPGLGVLFEIIWQESDEQQKNMMVDNLAKGV
ncbi:small acid-soluble spore protein I (minor) [Scopulibacillus daqui]|uniref:Small, acid-soluble spore protein I n=1 Tax=Scopulibacillus daqui TaxID=1469162 RepID=A0ABS2PXV6_9BACL|nr:small acid-soluble spore protein SspI [Scopulibacillus daqui]MBM7644771.1 small acid-soluble spore protein I (minor) [Scopulibacillus daqui]